jgi:hypothetical protein
MRHLRLAFPIAVAAVALASAGCGDGDATTAVPTATETTSDASTKGPTKLVGTVGSAADPDAYELTLASAGGAEVTTTLPPGRYALEIDDRSTIHSFHLAARNAAVELATGVAGTGRKSAVVLLRDGESYRYFCDAHPTAMNVTFSIHGRIRTQQ